jgi:hypothetical protein
MNFPPTDVDSPERETVKLTGPALNVLHARIVIVASRTD